MRLSNSPSILRTGRRLCACCRSLCETPRWKPPPPLLGTVAAIEAEAAVDEDGLLMDGCKKKKRGAFIVIESANQWEFSTGFRITFIA